MCWDKTEAEVMAGAVAGWDAAFRFFDGDLLALREEGGDLLGLGTRTLGICGKKNMISL